MINTLGLGHGVVTLYSLMGTKIKIGHGHSLSSLVSFNGGIDSLALSRLLLNPDSCLLVWKSYVLASPFVVRQFRN